ncbi:MAG: pyridoxamine 5'-phosphate oxidase [Phycisphaeraceae bacterium]|nr:pyridoxamine 5'-phosphate oxidase [Phycisphaeraceae bacterium]
MSAGQPPEKKNIPVDEAGAVREVLRGPLDAIHAFKTSRDEHLPDALPADPFPMLHEWVEYAKARNVQPNPTAMSLATVDDSGQPNARIVLCRGIDERDGSLWFFTNSHSAKGWEMSGNSKVAAVFHWDALDRQARVRGLAEPLAAEASDAYFASRTWEKRVGAWASDQSRPVVSRQALLDKLLNTLTRFGIDPANPPAADAILDIPRPPHWGGYRIVAFEVELWVGSNARIHDRARWTRPGPGRPWSAMRLQP